MIAMCFTTEGLFVEFVYKTNIRTLIRIIIQKTLLASPVFK